MTTPSPGGPSAGEPPPDDPVPDEEPASKPRRQPGIRSRAVVVARRGASRIQRYPRLLRAGIYLGRLGVQLWRKLVADDCLAKAAALAYTTVLAIVPMLAVAFLVFKLSGTFSGVEQRVREYLMSHLLAESVGHVSEYFNRFVGRVSAGAVGASGIVLFVFTATWLFITAESTLNRIWRVQQQRRLLHRFTIFWSLLTLGPVLLGAGLYLTAQFKSTALGRLLASSPVLLAVLSWLVPYLVSVVTLTLVYKLVPNTLVRWWPALCGAAVSGVLAEVSKQGFNVYVEQIYQASYTVKIYGAFALFPVFLLWIYLGWLVVLFGAEVAYTIQHLKVLYDEEFQRRVPEDESRADLSPYLTCRIMLLIAYRHYAGKPPLAQEDLVRVLRAPERAIYRGLKRLEEGDLIASLQQAGQAVYLPGRDIGRISLAAAIEAHQAGGISAAPDSASDATAALDDLFCDLSIAQQEATAGFSFRDLVEAAGPEAFEALFQPPAQPLANEVTWKEPPGPVAKAPKRADPAAKE